VSPYRPPGYRGFLNQKENHMISKQAFATAALFVATMGAASTAAAQSTASASVTNVNYQLIDLNPYDGIAPSITFGGLPAAANVVLYGDPGYTNPVLSDSILNYGTVSINNASGTAFAEIQETSNRSQVQVFSNSGFATSLTEFSFVLSANTRLIFTADASVTGTIDPAGGNVDATAWLQLGFPNEDGTNGQFNRSYLYTTDGDRSGHLLALLDSGAGLTNGTYAFGTESSASSLAAPIPEPASVAMLLAGLGALAGLQRRRASRT
jgi:hypothetical protein